jgi:hypothetical protein
MAYCLNPDCPHKKKIGRPAEFREGIAHSGPVLELPSLKTERRKGTIGLIVE